MNSTERITNLYTVPGTGITPASTQNDRHWGELPVNSGQFMSSSTFRQYPGAEGCYVVSAPIRSTFDIIDSIPKEVNVAHGVGQPLEAQTNTTLWLDHPRSAIGDTTAGLSSQLTWDTKSMPVVAGYSRKVFAASVHDGMSTEVIMITAPADHAQHFSIKFHARYEYVLDSVCTDFSKSVTVEADAEALDDIIHFASLMPGSYPESYNSGGKVWNAFVKGLKWVGKNVAMPILKAASLGAIGGVKTAVAKGFRSTVERSL
jgi:hypothetical protein